MATVATSYPTVAWRGQLKNQREDLKLAYQAGKLKLAPLLQQQQQLVDYLLKDIWQHFAFSSEFALIALGGYGRGQLFPHSDVDILILLPTQISSPEREKIEQLIGVLWDIGLDVGHSVRTLAECIEEAAKDITIQTSLLEARLIAGSASLFKLFQRDFESGLDLKQFFEAKLFEQQQRHMRYFGVAYNLEPNLKEGPGGLRDLQTILWISKACRLGNSWRELAQQGIITPIEAKLLQKNDFILQELRVALHYTAGRREERLLFEHQIELAKQFGLTDGTRRASEELMQRYYRAARRVLQLNGILLQNLRHHIYSEIQAPALILNERFQIRQGLLEIRHETVFQETPSAILEAFLLFQRHSELKDFSAATLRALWHARVLITPSFRRNPVNKSLFMTILREPSGLTRVLRRMHRYGILGRYIPAFGHITGQMQHDLFHVYTVDEHILMVVRNLRRFAVDEFSHEYPLCSRLIMGFEHPEVLYLAGLFHDIAKGRGGDHSKLGKPEALKFCRQHGLSAEDTHLVGWLVESHLTMSQVAQKQDLSDPHVIENFCKLVGNERQLIALYLLTVADIRGTSPKVWNAWKGKLLEDLLRASQRYFSGADFSLGQYLEERQEQAAELLRLYAVSATAQNQFWSVVDTHYFIKHDAKEIAWHTRLLCTHINTPSPIVRTRLSEGGEGLQVLIYTPDQRDLFAHICQFFERNQFTIADAKIHTTEHGYALDSFYVLSTRHQDKHYRELLSFIEYELTQKLSQPSSLLPPLTVRLSRQLRHFPITPEVHIRPDDRGEFYVMSIIAGDRPGLLSRIASILAHYQITLNSAKIVTLGERAEDIFLMSGDALHDPLTLLKVESDVLKALQAT